MNPVQIAYNAFEAHRKTFDEAKTLEARAEYLNKNLELARGVFYAIAEETKDRNPGLKRDVDNGNYDMWYLHDSTKCFVDRNWQIYPRNGSKCRQCGEVHHLPTEQDFDGVGLRIELPEDEYCQYTWGVIELKTNTVIEFGAEDSHLEAYEACETVINKLALKSMSKSSPTGRITASKPELQNIKPSN